jgi:hypothetical protein
MKRGVISEYLPWILIAVAVLVILIASAYLLRGKGFDAINAIKNLFSFR